tara:strand:+ start:7309 stop:8091 length:783 start_codon:yes stop_codon:yes gene_type:complete
MNELEKIVNIAKHPINNANYIKICSEKIKENSILVLDSFLNKCCLKELIDEASLLEDQAYYCSQNHTILLDKTNKSLEYEDPTNIEVVSDKGCVPHDLLNKNSKLNILYESNIFKNFLKGVLKLNSLYPYNDPLSSINYNYYQKSQQLGWHFDNASFAITLMIQSSDKGGVFEYVSKVRDYNKKFIDKKYIKKILEKKIIPQKIDVCAGTLVLFYGRNYLHRVTPVESKKPRILVTLNYNEEEGVTLSENARKTFFGRIN